MSQFQTYDVTFNVALTHLTKKDGIVQPKRVIGQSIQWYFPIIPWTGLRIGNGDFLIVSEVYYLGEDPSNGRVKFKVDLVSIQDPLGSRMEDKDYIWDSVESMQVMVKNTSKWDWIWRTVTLPS